MNKDYLKPFKKGEKRTVENGRKGGAKMTLARELAMRTKFLRDEVIEEIIEEEKKNGINNILGFYEAFKTYLIRGLKEEEFVDLYSQTITYGLFTSRMRCSGEFNRKTVIYDIPESIGILKDIFRYISSVEIPVPRDEKYLKLYNDFWKVTDIFP